MRKRGRSSKYIVSRETALKIREEFQSGIPYVIVAHKYNIAPSTAWRLISSQHPLVEDLPPIRRKPGPQRKNDVHVQDENNGS